MQNEVPRPLTLPVYIVSCEFVIATSYIFLQVPLENNILFSFGPVVPDGYGICYNPQKSHILFAVSAFKKCHETSATKFATKLFEAMHKMRIILESQSSTAKL